MFYAEYCPYGIDTLSDGDFLMAFDTRMERDELVDRINWNLDEHPVCHAVTTRDVRHRYDLRWFYDPDRSFLTNWRSCTGAGVFGRHHKPSYSF